MTRIPSQEAAGPEFALVAPAGLLITPAQSQIIDAAEAILQDPHVSGQDRAFIVTEKKSPIQKLAS
jgi:hypothetical protein